MNDSASLGDLLTEYQPYVIGAGVALLFFAFGLGAGPSVKRRSVRRARRKGKRYRETSPVRKAFGKIL